jgi:hypothetical protein
MFTKQEIIDEICDHLRIHRFVVSRGSTEPREFFVAVIEQLGIQSLTGSLDKSGLGRLIVEAGGQAWLPSFDSNGGTVTRQGLEAIQETVHRLIRPTTT